MRLIDADELKRVFIGKHYGVNAIKCFIEMQPTIDAMSVKHGRWEDCSNGWMCSVCKHDARKDYPYCPYCGSRMADPEWMWKAMRLIDTDR